MSRLEGPATKTTAKTQRVMNSLALLDAVRESPRTISELCAATGLSRTAVEAVTGILLESGWISDEAVGSHPGAGRPPRVISLRGEAGVVVGIDIGPHKVQVSVADLAGRMLARKTTKVSPELAAGDRLAASAALCAVALDEAGRELRDVWVVAVASPGVVQDGTVRHFIGLPGWEGLDIAAALSRMLGRPVVAENDCNLAAIAERWRGKAANVTDLVYILSGNRTGAGLILSGEIYRGWRGGAGEIGALPEAGWLRAPALIDGVKVGEDILNREEVFEAARRGHAEAISAVDRFAQALATGISALVLALDPQLVVVGGGVSRAGDLLREPLRRHIERMCIIRMPEFVFSELGDESVSLGAVRLGLDLVEERVAAIAFDELCFPSPHPDLLVADPSSPRGGRAPIDK